MAKLSILMVSLSESGSAEVWDAEGTGILSNANEGGVTDIWGGGLEVVTGKGEI